jgi:phosphoheptose isomerase
VESELYDFLQQSLEMKRLLAEEFSPQILAASQMMTECLTSDGKIIIAADRQTDGIAKTMHHQFIHGYQIERPSLPCLTLDSHAATTEQCSQLRALGNIDDLIVILGLDQESDSLEELVRTASEKGMRIILLAVGVQKSLSSDNVEFIFSTGSKTHLLENYLCLCLTLAALIDHQLFGSDL